MADPASWRPSSPAVDAASLTGILTQHRIVAIHVWAAWNWYDRPFDERLQALRNEFADEMKIVAMDADDPSNSELLHRYGVATVPALVVFNKGRHVETLIGMRTEQELRQRFEGWARQPGDPAQGPLPGPEAVGAARSTPIMKPPQSWKRRLKGILLLGFWAGFQLVLWHPACGRTDHSRQPGTYAIRRFGAFGYYRVRIDRVSDGHPYPGMFEGFDAENLRMTIVGSVLVTGACLVEWALTSRSPSPSGQDRVRGESRA
jgi:thioredoxin 1